MFKTLRNFFIKKDSTTQSTEELVEAFKKELFIF